MRAGQKKNQCEADHSPLNRRLNCVTRRQERWKGGEKNWGKVLFKRSDGTARIATASEPHGLSWGFWLTFCSWTLGVLAQVKLSLSPRQRAADHRVDGPHLLSFAAA